MDKKMEQIIEVEAVIIKADGTRKNLGVISSNKPLSLFKRILKYITRKGV